MKNSLLKPLTVQIVVPNQLWSSLSSGLPTTFIDVITFDKGFLVSRRTLDMEQSNRKFFNTNWEEISQPALYFRYEQPIPRLEFY